MADARPLTDEEVEAACKAVAPETKVSFKILKFKTRPYYVTTSPFSINIRISSFSKPCIALRIPKNHWIFTLEY